MLEYLWIALKRIVITLLISTGLYGLALRLCPPEKQKILGLSRRASQDPKVAAEEIETAIDNLVEWCSKFVFGRANSCRPLQSLHPENADTVTPTRATDVDRPASKSNGDQEKGTGNLESDISVAPLDALPEQEKNTLHDTVRGSDPRPTERSDEPLFSSEKRGPREENGSTKTAPPNVVEVESDDSTNLVLNDVTTASGNTLLLALNQHNGFGQTEINRPDNLPPLGSGVRGNNADRTDTVKEEDPSADRDTVVESFPPSSHALEQSDGHLDSTPSSPAESWVLEIPIDLPRYELPTTDITVSSLGVTESGKQEPEGVVSYPSLAHATAAQFSSHEDSHDEDSGIRSVPIMYMSSSTATLVPSRPAEGGRALEDASNVATYTGSADPTDAPKVVNQNSSHQVVPISIVPSAGRKGRHGKRRAGHTSPPSSTTLSKAPGGYGIGGDISPLNLAASLPPVVAPIDHNIPPHLIIEYRKAMKLNHNRTLSEHAAIKEILEMGLDGARQAAQGSVQQSVASKPRKRRTGWR